MSCEAVDMRSLGAPSKFGFFITCPQSGRTYYLCSMEEEERDLWIQAIVRFIPKYRATPKFFSLAVVDTDTIVFISFHFI
jgi:hypothetical protein